MELISVNTGLPQEIVWRGRSVLTAIYKQPVQGRVALRKLNLDGDRQADLSVHGGPDKAVCCDALEHYEYWKDIWPGREWLFGAFGENFTTFSRPEASVHIGDRFHIGSEEVVVTQPRLPCYKLGVKFQSEQMVKRFLASGRTGFYLAAAREGTVAAGDALQRIAQDSRSVPVSEVTRLHLAKTYGPADIESVRHALRARAMPDSWRRYFTDRLERVHVAAKQGSGE
jgi:MOSC domain-containing protein YiiM